MNMVKWFILITAMTSSSFAFSFYDDFEDNNIDDWEARCASATWYASGGEVHGSTSTNPGILLALEGPEMQNGSITVKATGQHAFGISARFDETDSGIVAYVSPDNDVARIRLVENGEQSTTLNSLGANFPAGVSYELTLECNDGLVTFYIEVPSTGDSWAFSATDPNPYPGRFGFHMGDEPGASWDWIEATGMAEGAASLTWFTTDDQASGDGDMCLEQGETIDLAIEISNNSDYMLDNAFGILQAMNPELVVVGNQVSYGSIPAMSSTYGTGVFTVMAPMVTPEDQSYEMRLTMFADEGYQKQISFSLPVGCGIENDFEGDIGGWTCGSVSAGWASDWHVSSTRNNTAGGQYSYKCGSTGSGDYSNHHYGYLESPYCNLPLYGDCSFWSWMEAQVLSSSVALDGGIVQYRRIDEWIDLFFVPACTHSITSGNTGPFPDNTDVYSGTVDWTEYSMLIPDSLAGPGAIRIVFGSDDTGNREGWYIDDFSITGTSGTEESSSGVVTQPFLSVSENPFSSSVTFLYKLPGAGEFTLEVFDLSGRVIHQLPVGSGEQLNSLVWSGSDASGEVIPAGVYFARVAGTEIESVRLVKF